MKTEERIRSAMEDHNLNAPTPPRLKKLVKEKGETEDYWRGIQAGVAWAYRWVLDEE